MVSRAKWIPLSGKPTHPQLETYKTLSQAWKDSLNWENKDLACCVLPFLTSL